MYDMRLQGGIAYNCKSTNMLEIKWKGWSAVADFTPNTCWILCAAVHQHVGILHGSTVQSSHYRFTTLTILGWIRLSVMCGYESVYLCGFSLLLQCENTLSGKMGTSTQSSLLLASSLSFQLFKINLSLGSPNISVALL